ncbi:MAG: hypothetical protein M3Z04_07735 [Chloroflexota bacterium]|nr:hypothetical protein [Chloroflexota bacterium]
MDDDNHSRSSRGWIEDQMANDRAREGEGRLKQVAVYYYPKQLIPLDEHLSRLNSRTRAYDGLKINRSTYLRLCGAVLMDLLADPAFAGTMFERLYDEAELEHRLRERLRDLLELQRAYQEGTLRPVLPDL